MALRNFLNGTVICLEEINLRRDVQKSKFVGAVGFQIAWDLHKNIFEYFAHKKLISKHSKMYPCPIRSTVSDQPS